jgi:hypothetical protein
MESPLKRGSLMTPGADDTHQDVGYGSQSDRSIPCSPAHCSFELRLSSLWRHVMKHGSNHGSDWQSISRLHKNWADRYMAVWHACMLAVYAAAFLLLVTAGVGPSERTDAYIVLGALLIVGAVWQSAGLTLARIHMLIDDISLEAPKRQPPKVSDEPPPEVITGF